MFARPCAKQFLDAHLAADQPPLDGSFGITISVLRTCCTRRPSLVSGTHFSSSSFLPRPRPLPRPLSPRPRSPRPRSPRSPRPPNPRSKPPRSAMVSAPQAGTASSQLCAIPHASARHHRGLPCTVAGIHTRRHMPRVQCCTDCGRIKEQQDYRAWTVALPAMRAAAAMVAAA